MTYYYVDPASAGSNTGLNWDNAWTDIQSAFDTAVAGDTVYCRGTQIVTLTVAVDTNSGSLAAGFIRFVGENASGTNDGTPFFLNGNGALAADILNWNGMDFYLIENFKFAGTTGSGNDGISHTGSYTQALHNIFVNCDFTDCDDGYFSNSGSLNSPLFIKCRFENNRALGFSYLNSGTALAFLGCSFKDNGTGNFSSNDFDNYLFYGCLFDGSPYGPVGGNTSGGLGVFLNCVLHGATTRGFSGKNNVSMLFGCRVTGNAIGLYLQNLIISMFSYLPGEGQDEDNTVQTQGTGVAIYKPLINGVDTNNFAGTDSGGGYADAANGDFNLSDTASIRQVGLDID